jgi:hypothetical protein
MGWVIFVAGAVLSWGAYGALLHMGQTQLGNPLKALLCVGVAYFLIGVIIPVGALSAQGNLSQIMPVRAGQHNIRLRIEPDDAAMQEDSIRGDFSNHTERDLAVAARHSGLWLSWQGTGRAAETSANFDWLLPYAGSLLLTITGSIMSALAGYAIKELPSQLRSTSDSAPKTGQSSVRVSTD